MSGIFGNKIGMTQIFDDSGKAVGVTVVQAGPCIVEQVKTFEKEGYNAVKLNYNNKRKEFRISNPEEYKVGQEIKVDIFKPGDMIKVTGKTVGKGFAGVVKRYHDHRGPMTHGSKSHRIPGSSGSGTTPGRVWKGRHMPGRLGGGQATVRGAQVFQIDAEKNLILIKGSVPGKKGNLVSIRKA